MSNNSINDNKKKESQYKRLPKTLSVKSAINITPNMRRVTLVGDALKDFPLNAEGAVIKLIFEQAQSEELAQSSKPPMRTYTLAQQRQSPHEIDIDFMLHSHKDINLDDDSNSTSNTETQGIAVPWALSAKANDQVTFFGPGPVRFINLDAEYFLLAADMTALPALKANLKLLDINAVGKVFIEILSEADKQTLQLPENIELTWIINDTPGSDESPLFHAIQESEWPNTTVAIWAACEYKTMKKIRHYVKDERGIERSHFYVSSYWKKGDTEEQHKVIRKADKNKEK